MRRELILGYVLSSCPEMLIPAPQFLITLLLIVTSEISACGDLPSSFLTVSNIAYPLCPIGKSAQEFSNIFPSNNIRFPVFNSNKFFIVQCFPR